MQAEVLLIDDDRRFWEEARLALGREFRVITADSGAAARARILDLAPDVVLLDVHLGEEDGREVLRELRRLAPEIPVLMLSVTEDVAVVVDCMKSGAWHYVPKSASVDLLRQTVHRAVAYGRAEKQRLYYEGERDPDDGPRLIGESAAMRRLRAEIARVAPTEVDVLLTGESGTGKEVVAREIHRQSLRADAVYLPVDLLALPEQLADARLFGNEKGAFTGAETKRIGAIEAANGGTVLIDEIGELSSDVQKKLLRFIQERTFLRLGGTKWLHSDVRLITATNRNLDAMVAQGEFRADLYHRIHVYRIQVPPLRARTEDIPTFAAHFLEKLRARTHRTIVEIDDEALAHLGKRDWSGNVRQLGNAIEAAMVRCTGNRLTRDCFCEGDPAIPSEDSTPRPGDPDPLPIYAEARERALNDFRRDYLTRMLRRTGGVVNEAARRAGLSPASMRRMLKDAGLR